MRELNKGYSRIDASVPEPDDLPLPPPRPWLARVLPILLWAFVICALGNLFNMINLRRLAIGTSGAKLVPTASYPPMLPGTLAHYKNQDPLFPSMLETDTLDSVYAGGLDNARYIRPDLAGTYRRFNADGSVCDRLETIVDTGRFEISYEHEPFLRFQNFDTQKTSCAIGMFKTQPELGEVFFGGSKTTALVWNITQPDSASSSSAQQPRRSYLGEINFAEDMSLTHPFTCPKDGTLLVQMDCKQWDICHIEVEQAKEPDAHFGVYLIQW